MGVPYLAGYYFKKYNRESELIKSVEDITNIDYLFFDYNSLIHPIVHKLSIKTDESIINECIKYTQLIINIVNPIDTFICVDGIAPRSKCNQQRERRYKSKFLKEFEGKSVEWDTNQITPGTNFMEKLSIELKKHFKNVSDSNEPSEGEHKIMNYLQKINKKQIAIYGLDADLILLSLLNQNNDIVLVRDSDSGLDITKINYLNISVLKNLIYKDLLENYPKYSLSQDVFINDYILLTFLLGNDFTEHLFCLSIKHNGIDIVLQAYINSYNGQQLVDKSKTFNNWINITILKDVFFKLKYYESKFLTCHNYNKIRDISEETISEFNLDCSKNIFFYHNKQFKDKESYYSFYRLTDINDACYNYIKNIYWILGYYNQSHQMSHSNWNFYYKYHCNPMCSDIFNYLSKNKISINFEKDEPWTSKKQLLYVLPKESYSNLVNKNEKLLDNKTLFPDKLIFDLNYKDYLWQSKLVFEPINDILLYL